MNLKESKRRHFYIAQTRHYHIAVTRIKHSFTNPSPPAIIYLIQRQWVERSEIMSLSNDHSKNAFSHKPHRGAELVVSFQSLVIIAIVRMTID